MGEKNISKFFAGQVSPNPFRKKFGFENPLFIRFGIFPLTNHLYFQHQKTYLFYSSINISINIHTNTVTFPVFQVEKNLKMVGCYLVTGGNLFANKKKSY